MKIRSVLLILPLGVLLFFGVNTQSITFAAQDSVVQFAIIGDYGLAGSAEAAVAALVKSWNPNFILTVGDNNYDTGAAATIDANIGQYYHDYIFPYLGSYGAGASGTNRFFPVLGNHDWETPNAQPYLDYFTLPGNERYYDFASGPVHFFMLDSDTREPDGISSTSTQANWLRSQITAATQRWKLVFLHHAPYSSGIHGSTPAVQWPYADWGADAVFAGHDHHYERVFRNGIVYYVDGAGGSPLYPTLPIPIAGSQVRYYANYGALRVTASEATITFDYYSVANGGTLIDTYTLYATPLNAVPSRNYYQSTPPLTWSRISWATAYHVQVDNDSDFSSALYDDDDVSPHTLSAAIPGLTSGLYHWRVQARRSDGSWGPWSNVDAFTIAPP